MIDYEFADRTRSMIEHENILRDQRLNWLIATEGFLIAALGFSWDKEKFLVLSLAIIGLVFCISMGANLYCNTLAIRNLANKWNAQRSTAYNGPSVVGLRSEDITPHFVTKLYPWNIIPISLSLFWIFVLCYVIWR